MKAEIGEDIHIAKDFLDKNGLVAIPTETVYGLAANALDKHAVLRIFEAKNRPKFDPLIIHVAAIEEVEKYAQIDKKLMDIATAVWPGPLTLLLNRKEIVPDLVTSGLDKVAIRIPNHRLTLDLLKSLDYPLAAPSANPFGYISPTRASHVADQLGDRIDYILDGGTCSVGLESTIIGMEEGILKIYRNGGLPLEDIQKLYKGDIEMVAQSSSDPLAPGMLKKHYSPNKIVRNYADFEKLYKVGDKVGFLNFSSLLGDFSPEIQFILSDSADLKEASQRLFEGLRYLDKLDIDVIYLENVPNLGLGLAINDRLKRAAAAD